MKKHGTGIPPVGGMICHCPGYVTENWAVNQNQAITGRKVWGGQWWSNIDEWPLLSREWGNDPQLLTTIPFPHSLPSTRKLIIGGANFQTKPDVLSVIESLSAKNGLISVTHPKNGADIHILSHPRYRFSWKPALGWCFIQPRWMITIDYCHVLYGFTNGLLDELDIYGYLGVMIHCIVSNSIKPSNRLGRKKSIPNSESSSWFRRHFKLGKSGLLSSSHCKKTSQEAIETRHFWGYDGPMETKTWTYCLCKNEGNGGMAGFRDDCELMLIVINSDGFGILWVIPPSG